MATKTVYNLNIRIDPVILKMNGLLPKNLCIAKQVNGRYTVVFQSAGIGAEQRVLQDVNKFSWEDEYRVCTSKEYEKDTTITITDIPTDIRLGQIARYDKSQFRISPAEEAEPSRFKAGTFHDSFMLGSIPENIHASVLCKTGDNWSPIYVDRQLRNGLTDHEMRPSNLYALFWSSSHVAGSIIDFARVRDPWEFELDHPSRRNAGTGMTFTLEMTLRFGFEKPGAPKDSNENPTWRVDSQG